MVLRNFGFRLVLAKMVESNGCETFMVYLEHPDRPLETSILDDTGSICVYSDTDIDKVRYTASEYAKAMGIPENDIVDNYVEDYPESPDSLRNLLKY